MSERRRPGCGGLIGAPAAAAVGLLASSLGGAQAVPAKDTANRTELSHSCSRVVARNVRKEMEKQLVKPAVRALGSALPTRCPLDPSSDLYAGHERAKQRKRGSSSAWICGYCGKNFKGEHYLDLHLERKHMDQAPAGGICLADYCEMFEACGAVSALGRRRTERIGRQPPSCDNSTMARAKRSCEAAMGRCFSLDKGGPSRELHAKYSRTYCHTLDCLIRAEQWKEQHTDMVPVVVLFIFIVVIGLVFFSVVVCCVDSSDDIIQFLVDSGMASSKTAKGLVQARDGARQGLGMGRARGV